MSAIDRTIYLELLRAGLLSEATGRSADTDEQITPQAFNNRKKHFSTAFPADIPCDFHIELRSFSETQRICF